MPGMNGGDLARHLTRHLAGLRPETRVLYASGYTGNTIVHHGVLEADVASLQQPNTIAELGSKVRAVLDPPG